MIKAWIAKMEALHPCQLEVTPSALHTLSLEDSSTCFQVQNLSEQSLETMATHQEMTREEMSCKAKTQDSCLGKC